MPKFPIPNTKANCHAHDSDGIYAYNQDLRRDFSELKVEVKRDLADLENRITIKLGTIVSIAIGVAVALTKLI